MESINPKRSVLFLLIIALSILASGCTTALWNKSTFAHYYRPADTPNLRLFYSNERRDVLVRYDERQDSDDRIQPRCYWLERSSSTVNGRQKPKFVPLKTCAAVLVPIPVHETSTNEPSASLHGLYAVAQPNQDSFTLYAGRDELEQYHLPVYSGDRSQKIKQVALTPVAVAVDATIVGAVIGYYAAPSILQGFNR